jgi:hypothetical protein
LCRAKRQPTLPTAICKHDLFLCCPLRFTAGIAAARRLRQSFIFLIDEILKYFFENLNTKQFYKLKSFEFTNCRTRRQSLIL